MAARRRRYGLAALCAPSARGKFAGIEHADSFIVDPHKWLFSPFDSCALLYRDPALARAAHRQHASYLDALYADDAAYNPSDYGVHLTRRARGLPSGSRSPSTARTRSRRRSRARWRSRAPARTRSAHARARAADRARAVRPFRSPPRLGHGRLRPRAADLRADGTAFVMPTTVAGEPSGGWRS